jgi:hypothetical protein
MRVLYLSTGVFQMLFDHSSTHRALFVCIMPRICAQNANIPKFESSHSRSRSVMPVPVPFILLSLR